MQKKVGLTGSVVDGFYGFDTAFRVMEWKWRNRCPENRINSTLGLPGLGLLFGEIVWIFRHVVPVVRVGESVSADLPVASVSRWDDGRLRSRASRSAWSTVACTLRHVPTALRAGWVSLS